MMAGPINLRFFHTGVNFNPLLKEKAVVTVIFEIVRSIDRGFENEVLRKIFASKGQEDEVV